MWWVGCETISGVLFEMSLSGERAYDSDDAMSRGRITKVFMINFFTQTYLGKEPVPLTKVKKGNLNYFVLNLFLVRLSVSGAMFKNEAMNF